MVAEEEKKKQQQQIERKVACIAFFFLASQENQYRRWPETTNEEEKGEKEQTRLIRFKNFRHENCQPTELCVDGSNLMAHSWTDFTFGSPDISQHI